MYLKDKDFSVHIRLDSSDYAFLTRFAKVQNKTVSDVVRMVISDLRFTVERMEVEDYGSKEVDE